MRNRSTLKRTLMHIHGTNQQAHNKGQINPNPSLMKIKKNLHSSTYYPTINHGNR